METIKEDDYPHARYFRIFQEMETGSLLLYFELTHRDKWQDEVPSTTEALNLFFQSNPVIHKHFIEYALDNGSLAVRRVLPLEIGLFMETDAPYALKHLSRLMRDEHLKVRQAAHEEVTILINDLPLNARGVGVIERLTQMSKYAK